MVECGNNWLMDQSRAGWPMKWSTGKKGLDRRRDSQTQAVGGCISDDGSDNNNSCRYCTRARPDVLLDGGRGCSEVDLFDMCGFCTAVDGGKRVYRCKQTRR
jgi:hypothetical protein